jgi:hypothetical protein
MTGAAIIREAAADGVSLALSPAGTIKATGDQVAVSRWLPVLREHKAAILAELGRPEPLPRLPRGLGGYTTPGVPPLGDCELARQIRSMPKDDHVPADLREHFEERAAVLEHDAGMARPEAELEAARITATLARNRGYLWTCLRSALAGYPLLLAQVPDRPGPIHSLPFGTARVHVRTEAEIEAARIGRTVVRQGDFTGAPEVKP